MLVSNCVWCKKAADKPIKSEAPIVLLKYACGCGCLIRYERVT